MPICPNVGKAAIKAVLIPIIVKLNTSILFRPILSPKCPNIIPPTGLTTKPAANVPKASIVETKALPVGKYSWLNTIPATTP